MLGSHECIVMSADIIKPYLESMAEMMNDLPPTVLNAMREKFGECPVYNTQTMVRLVDSAPITSYTF